MPAARHERGRERAESATVVIGSSLASGVVSVECVVKRVPYGCAKYEPRSADGDDDEAVGVAAYHEGRVTPHL